MPINQTLEEEIRERFSSLEEAPPPLAWNKIRQEIAPVAAPQTTARRPEFKWLMPGAVIAVISMALLVLLKYTKALEQQEKATLKEYMVQAQKSEQPEQVEKIVAEQPVSVVPAKEPAFKAYEAAPEKPVEKQTFVKKRYLKAAENPQKPENTEKLQAKAAAKKIPATKVVYVVTVDPKSASVEKIATAETDSAATTN